MKLLKFVNFLANNYYALSSLTILDEKVGLAGILFTVVIVIYKLVRLTISRRCFSPGFLAQNASTSEFVPALPDDILMEILVRLPVSSIFHFRCVSRSLRSLVLESHTSNRLPPVLVGVFCVSKEYVSYVSLRKGFGDSSMDYDPIQFLEESSLCYGMKDCKFGLVLCTKSWAREIYLCNPATKKCRSIASNYPDDCHFVLAFDPSWSKHHYEVIKISHGCMGSGFIFEVFSSKTGRWDRKFSVTDYYIDLELQPCFANGLLYMFEVYYSGLVAINCADGSYKRVTLPCNIRGGEQVGALCNSSGTLMYSKFCRGEVSVWTLLKNENDSCWLLRHQISLKDNMKKIGFSFPFDTQDDAHYDCILLFHLDTIVLHINFKTFYYNLETDQLQADMSRVYNGLLLPWSPCYYAVAGL